MGGKEALSQQPGPSKHKQHLPSHTAVRAIRKLWEQESYGSEVGWRAAGRRDLGAAES